MTTAPAACTSATEATGVPVGAASLDPAAPADEGADTADEGAAEDGADEGAEDAADEGAADPAEVGEPPAADVVVPAVVEGELLPEEQAAAVARTAVPDTASRVRRGRARAGSDDTVVSSRSAASMRRVVIFTRILVDGPVKVQRTSEFPGGPRPGKGQITIWQRPRRLPGAAGPGLLTRFSTNRAGEPQFSLDVRWWPAAKSSSQGDSGQVAA